MFAQLLSYFVCLLELFFCCLPDSCSAPKSMRSTFCCLVHVCTPLRCSFFFLPLFLLSDGMSAPSLCCLSLAFFCCLTDAFSPARIVGGLLFFLLSGWVFARLPPVLLVSALVGQWMSAPTLCCLYPLVLLSDGSLHRPS